MKRYLVGVGGEWRMRARDRGEWRRLVETVIKTGLVMKKKGKHKSTTGIGASLKPGLLGKRRRTTTRWRHHAPLVHQMAPLMWVCRRLRLSLKALLHER